MKKRTKTIPRTTKPAQDMMPFSDDRLARFTFSDTKKAAGLFREFLPPELVACLDLDALVGIKEQHVNHKLRERRDDLNFECPIIMEKTSQAKHKLQLCIRILVEHKSAHDPGLWFQLMDSIFRKWSRDGFEPVLTVVLHTGEYPFHLESPQSKLAKLGAPQQILAILPQLPVQAIDLSKSSMDSIGASAYLDSESKVILSIMKLVQSKQVTANRLYKLFKYFYPNETTEVQRMYMEAAINYIRYKVPLLKDEIETLRIDMSLAHPIHPGSVFAQELREEHQMGVEEGLEKGLEQGLEKGLELDRIQVVQSLLANGCDWTFIHKITSLDQQGYEMLRAKHGMK